MKRLICSGLALLSVPATLGGMDVKEYLSQIGRRGGAVKSQKKADACRANARKPRPNARKVRDLDNGKNN